MFAYRKEAAVKVPGFSTLVTLSALALCAGCVGGKLLDSSAALLDDERRPRPYPSPSLASVPGSAKAEVAVSKAPVGTGVATAKAEKTVAKAPPQQVPATANDVTLANHHLYAAGESNVVKIAPGRIANAADPSAAAAIATQPAAESAPRSAKGESPAANPRPSATEQANAVASALNRQAAVPELPPTTPPILNDPLAANLRLSQVNPQEAAAPTVLEHKPHPVKPAIHEEPVVSPPAALAKEEANPQPGLPAPTADDLLPEDPLERAAWLQERYLTALEEALKAAHKSGNKEETGRLDQHLRLAYLLAEQPEEAARGVDSLPEGEREAYKQLMFGLTQFLSPDDARRPAHRNARVAKALREAVRELSPVSRLELKNLAFCERVEQFGWFTEFRRAEFGPKQQVILYVEVENATAEEKGQHNFETELAGSYQIFDEAGKLAHERTLPLDKETCRNARRDYFLAYRIYLPEDIAAGKYRLELTIEDLKAKRSGNRKLGEGFVEFRVR